MVMWRNVTFTYFFLIKSFKQLFVIVSFVSIFTIMSQIFKLQNHEMIKLLNKDYNICNFWSVHTLYTEFRTCLSLVYLIYEQNYIYIKTVSQQAPSENSPLSCTKVICLQRDHFWFWLVAVLQIMVGHRQLSIVWEHWLAKKLGNYKNEWPLFTKRKDFRAAKAGRSFFLQVLLLNST